MRNAIAALLLGFMAIIFASATFIYQSNFNQQTQMQQLTKQITSISEIYECEVENLQNNLSSLWDLHPYVNEDSRTKLYEFVKMMGYCPGTNFVLAPGKSNLSILMNRDLYKSLCAYNGPTGLITSVHRKGNSHSQHYHQKAIDVAWDSTVADWIMSEQGEKWIARYNLEVFFENIPQKAKYAKYYMYNEHATGPHIHIQLSKSKNAKIRKA